MVTLRLNGNYVTRCDGCNKDIVPTEQYQIASIYDYHIGCAPAGVGKWRLTQQLYNED